MSQELVSKWYLNSEFGFNQIPPAGPQKVLTKAILICAKGDGELSPTEREFALGFGAACNLGEGDLDELRSYAADDDIASVVGSDPLVQQFGKRAGLYFAIRSAQADGDLAEGEVATIKRLAEQIGESAETVQHLVALTEAEEGLRKLRASLLLPEGAPFQQ